jgi:hypothetical protein
MLIFSQHFISNKAVLALVRILTIYYIGTYQRAEAELAVTLSLSPWEVLAYSVPLHLVSRGLSLFELKVFPLGKNLITFVSLPP